MTIRITGDGPKITATGSGSTVLVEISTGQHDPGSFSGVHNDLTGRSTTGAHVGTAVSIDPTGFNGNLDGTITNAQLLAAAVDDLTTGGGGGGGASLSDTTPQALGTAAAGTGTAAARDDHVHAMPTATSIAVDASGFNGNLTTSDDTVQEIAQKLDDLSIPAAGIADPGGANDDFLQRKSGAWTNRTVAQVKADLGSPSSIPRFYGDDIYSGLMGFNHASIGGGGSALVYGQNLLVLWRIMPVQDVTIDGVQFLVNTDGGSGALARVGIYGQASTTEPTGAPLVDSGAIGVNVSNGTIVTAAITATALSAFTPYWGAFVTNSATLSVRWLASGISYTARAGSIDAGQVNSSNHALRRVAHTFGALPSSPTAPFTNAYTDIPGVLWKVQV